MKISTILFFIFASTTIAAAVGLLLSRNVFKATLCLLACLLSVAALFVLNEADFVGVAQILVYAGGVVVLVIFGIMLTTSLAGKPLEVSNTNLFSGAGLGLLVLSLIGSGVLDEEKFLVEPGSSSQGRDLGAIGIQLMTKFSIPFEIAGILLLVALVGASVLTSFLKVKKW